MVITSLQWMSFCARAWLETGTEDYGGDRLEGEKRHIVAQIVLWKKSSASSWVASDPSYFFCRLRINL